MLTGEQTTALSNVVLASVSGWLAWRSRPAWLAAALWSALASAAAGAVFHGFRHTAPPPLLLATWKLVLLGLAATSATLVVSVLRRARLRAWSLRALYVLILAKLGASLVASVRSNGLTVLGVDFALTLLVVGVLEWRRATAEPRARWSLAAVAVTLFGLILQATGLRHGLPFCHNDAFHLLQAVAFALFYRGLRDRAPGAAFPDALVAR